MITWRGRQIDGLTTAELRIALEDACNELVRAHHSFGASQVITTLGFGFAIGTAATLLAMLVVRAVAG